MSKRLDPDQAQPNIRSDWGPNCLQRLSVNKEINMHMLISWVKNQNFRNPELQKLQFKTCRMPIKKTNFNFKGLIVFS